MEPRDSLPIQLRTRPNSGHYWHTGDHKANIGIKAVAWDYFLLTVDEKEDKVIFDEPGKTESRRLKCVVVGKQKMAVPSDEQTHYVLVIASTPGSASIPKASISYQYRIVLVSIVRIDIESI